MWTQQLKISLGMYETQNPKCTKWKDQLSFNKKTFLTHEQQSQIHEKITSIILF